MPALREKKEAEGVDLVVGCDWAREVGAECIIKACNVSKVQQRERERICYCGT
jgi:hypothetical protein